MQKNRYVQRHHVMRQSSACSGMTNLTEVTRLVSSLWLSFVRGRFQQLSVRCLKPTKIFWRSTGRRLRCAGSTTSSWWSLKVCREIRVTAENKICVINWAALFLGNIRVLCRVKPVLKEDQHEEGQSVVVTTDPNNESSLNVLNKGKGRIFELDKVFHPQATQEEVCKQTAHSGNIVTTRTLTLCLVSSGLSGD